MRHQYLDDFLRGISVFVIFSYGIGYPPMSPSSIVLASFFIVVTLFILLSWCQNKACLLLDRYVILALNNAAVWSNHAVLNFTGNHVVIFVKFLFFKRSSKIGIWVFGTE